MGFFRNATSTLMTLGAGTSLVVGLVPAGATGVSDDETPRQPDVPERVIDLHELPTGPEPTRPWIESDTIRIPGGIGLPLDPDLDITELGPVGRARFIGLDDTTGSGGANRLVQVGAGDTREIAEGPVVRPFVVSADRQQLSWSQWSDDEQEGRLVLADTGSGEVLHETTVDAEVYPIGFVQDMVVAREAELTEVLLWTPGEEIGSVPETVGATATDPERGLASVITDFVEDPDGWSVPCSSVVDLSGGSFSSDDGSADDGPGVRSSAGDGPAADGSSGAGSADAPGSDGELWSSCDVTPMSFSPDGRFVWARDTRTDEAVPDSMFLVDAATGEPVWRADIQGTTQRVAWERDGSVVFDAWTGGDMAIVRCAVTPDGDCEVATEPRPHEWPSDQEPLPYLLAQR